MHLSLHFYAQTTRMTVTTDKQSFLEMIERVFGAESSKTIDDRLSVMISNQLKYGICPKTGKFIDKLEPDTVSVLNEICTTPPNHELSLSDVTRRPAIDVTMDKVVILRSDANGIVSVNHICQHLSKKAAQAIEEEEVESLWNPKEEVEREKAQSTIPQVQVILDEKNTTALPKSQVEPELEIAAESELLERETLLLDSTETDTSLLTQVEDEVSVQTNDPQITPPVIVETETVDPCEPVVPAPLVAQEEEIEPELPVVEETTTTVVEPKVEFYAEPMTTDSGMGISPEEAAFQALNQAYAIKHLSEQDPNVQFTTTPGQYLTHAKAEVQHWIAEQQKSGGDELKDLNASGLTHTLGIDHQIDGDTHQVASDIKDLMKMLNRQKIQAHQGKYSAQIDGEQIKISNHNGEIYNGNPSTRECSVNQMTFAEIKELQIACGDTASAILKHQLQSKTIEGPELG